MNDQSPAQRLDRRVWIQGAALMLGAAGATQAEASRANARLAPLAVGLVTDMHYADKPAAGSRHYRDSLTKLEAAADTISQAKPGFVVELGDFVDAADSVQEELGFLKRIDREFAALSDNRHYVLGNHCVHTLKKEEFLGAIEREKSYYSFDSAGRHFIVLDACFRSDGQPYGRQNFKWTDPNLPPAEVEWLRADLKANSLPTIVFVHQRLDVSNHYGIKNAKAVREVLEGAGNVQAVFQGHSHKNDYKQIGGIHYCTLAAMVEGSGASNNAFSLLHLEDNGAIRVEGFVKQADYQWS